LLQQNIHGAKIAGHASVTSFPLNLDLSAKYVLRRRGDSRGALINASRVLRNRLISRTLGATRPVTAFYLGVRAKQHSLSFRPSRKATFKPAARAFGFLAGTKHCIVLPEAMRSVQRSAAALDRRSLHYREVQFYHNRPYLRLPKTAVTRSRKRKAGLVTFIRNSLENARTILGQSRALLPPANAYSRAAVVRHQGFAPDANTLTTYRRRGDLLPIFWRKAHSRANIKAVNRVRRRRYATRKRFYKLRHAR